MSKDTFWIENPYILFEKDELVKFVPTKDMTLIQKMNAVTRFCLYGLIIGQLFNFKDTIMYLLCSIIILTIISYKIQLQNNDSEKLNLFSDEQIEQLSDKLSDVLSTNKNILNHLGKCNTNKDDTGNDNNNTNADTSQASTKCNAVDNKNNSTSNIEDLIKVKLETPNDKSENNIIDQNICKQPTKDNPLMNINIGDNPNQPPPCKHTKDIKQNINDKFNYNLYRDVDDVFERYNSQRQYYTMPATTVPNNQTEFAEWLYKSPPTCKESSLCLRTEDKRYHN